MDDATQATGQAVFDWFEPAVRPARPADGKRQLGQFYTTSNPFSAPCFAEWWNLARPDTVLEPFAGANHIPRLLAGYRAATCDVTLTPFKGLRADGEYRRRLEYGRAARILDAAAERLGVPVGDGQLRLW